MKTAVIWDKPVMFTRLVEDCGHECELVTPHLLAAPFFRKRFHAVIIPSGFASPAFSRVLPALRAVSGRLKSFVEAGGVLLVFGAGDTCPDAYNWLPVPVHYRFGFSEERLTCDDTHPYTCICENLPDMPAIDGTLETAGGTTILSAGDRAVLWACNLAKGTIVLTTLHEYPSRRFLSEFCTDASEALL